MGDPHLSCKRDEIKMRDYMYRRVTPPKRVTSLTWCPLPPRKQALRTNTRVWKISQCLYKKKERLKRDKASKIEWGKLCFSCLFCLSFICFFLLLFTCLFYFLIYVVSLFTLDLFSQSCAYGACRSPPHWLYPSFKSMYTSFVKRIKVVLKLLLLRFLYCCSLSTMLRLIMP